MIGWLRRADPTLAAVLCGNPPWMFVGPAVVRREGNATPESCGGIPLQYFAGGSRQSAEGRPSPTARSGALRRQVPFERDCGVCRPPLRRPSGPDPWENVGPGVGGLKLSLGEITCKSERQPIKT